MDDSITVLIVASSTALELKGVLQYLVKVFDQKSFWRLTVLILLP